MHAVVNFENPPSISPPSQYPVYFVLVVLATIQAYVQPYRHALWNVLELLVSVDVLVLLLIRNTDYIEEFLQVHIYRITGDIWQSKVFGDLLTKGVWWE